jgi:D-sedoheptulose 7-phosphate isomerase
LREIVEKILADSLEVKERYILDNMSSIILLAEKIATAFTNDRKLLLCGNGPAAATAQVIAAGFVNRYSLPRPPLPAMALSSDSVVLTGIAGEYSFDDVFSKQVKSLGMGGDVLLAVSADGNDESILSAVKAAGGQKMYTAAFIGADGGRLADLLDLPLVAAADQRPRIAEAHMLAGHILCHLVDHILFQSHLSEG